MNWDAIGAGSEFVAALAVLATLVYLALQVRDARKILLLNAHQNRTERNIQINLAQANDGEYNQLMAKVARGESLDLRELNHAAFYWTAFMRHFEDLHYEWEQGALDMESWQATQEGLKMALNAPWAYDLWHKRSRIFRKTFVQQVNLLVNQNS